jgi:phosphatidylglycerophosphate synthase
MMGVVKPTDVKPDEIVIVGMRLYRLLAAPVATMAVRWGISANAVTSMSLAAGAGAGLALRADNLVLGAALLEAMVLLDFADGMVARRTGSTSSLGFVYDFVGDRVKIGWLLLCMATAVGVPRFYVVAALACMCLILADTLSIFFVPIETMRVVSAGGPIEIARWRRAIVGNLIRFDMHIVGLLGFVLLLGAASVEAVLSVLALSLALNLGRVCYSRLQVDLRARRVKVSRNRGVWRRVMSRLGAG